MTRSIHRHRSIGLLATTAALAVLTLVPAAVADSPQSTADAADAADAQATAPEPAADSTTDSETGAVDFSGMVVQIDPETGRLRPPTAEEAEALSRALARRLGVRSMSAASHTEHQLEGGAVALELDSSYHDYSIVRRAEDGTLVTDCVHGEHAAIELAQTPLAAGAGEATATDAPEVK